MTHCKPPNPDAATGPPPPPRGGGGGGGSLLSAACGYPQCTSPRACVCMPCSPTGCGCEGRCSQGLLECDARAEKDHCRARYRPPAHRGSTINHLQQHVHFALAAALAAALLC